jgi:glycosyltransferase involved in cell wall biosynthesis
MNGDALSYAIVTPVWNEEERLPVLAACIEAQRLLPTSWILVDTGSSDSTPFLVAELASRQPWIRSIELVEARAARGGPVVRGFAAGIRALGSDLPDVVVKLDADLTFDESYFQELLDGFAREPRLGIASGLCYEQTDGEWRPVYGTRSHVWGASRAYRRACLEEVLPLEERQGWDEIDAIKAQLHGWRVGTLFGVPFRHHRAEGRRDGGRRRWLDQGDTAHYMGYRFSYLLVRALFKARRDPVALAMVEGYLRAVVRRAPVLPDRAARTHLRDTQRLRMLPVRVREALGKG